jgi:hypothetical protein
MANDPHRDNFNVRARAVTKAAIVFAAPPWYILTANSPQT